MKILLVKLSSLGDVAHTLPVVQDIRQALPGARIDWVVEEGFAPLVARCEGVARVVPCALRRWRKSFWTGATRRAWRAFRADLQAQAYDAVIDLQGLTKSAGVARLARLAPGGRRYAMAHGTDGSSYEAPTRWLADVAIALPRHVHAVQRARLLCAAALGYAAPDAVRQPPGYGLRAQAARVPDPCAPATDVLAAVRTVALVMGSSRADKLWPQDSWVALGRFLLDQGLELRLVHGSAAEEAACQALAQQLGHGCATWPRLALDALLDRLAGCAGAVGVDSGVSHIAVALGLRHVQIYNFPTAWRTGPLGQPHQCSVEGQPTPSVDAVVRAWQRCAAA